MISITSPRGLAVAASLLIAIGPLSSARAQVDPIFDFKIDPQGAAHLPYMPVFVPLSPIRPEGLKKEPAYQGKPEYAVVHVGNGPASDYIVAVDEPASGDFKIYFDKNRNGDLTDDGGGAWSKKKQQGEGETTWVLYGADNFVVRASYGTAGFETSSDEYSLNLYRISIIPDTHALLMYRGAARVGTVTVDGKSHKAKLVENDADGLFDKPVGDDGKPVAGKGHTKPVWLLVDMDDDGKFSSGLINASAPFKLGDKVYVADISPDGSSLKLSATTRKVPEGPVPGKPFLTAGTVAPDFQAVAVRGGADSLTLSQYKGKVVILDFWATWCGPCQASMPHLEKVYDAVKDQDVVVLAICVMDGRAAYDKWVPEHKDQYTFTVAFDPAGRNPKGGISSNLYHVDGIPTTYIIGKDGKVFDGLVGFDGDKDKRLEGVLDRLGIKVTAPASVGAK